ncbi:MAG TPA: L,D-transpeptidase [Xanthobacteraceae bacterium]
MYRVLMPALASAICVLSVIPARSGPLPLYPGQHARPAAPAPIVRTAATQPNLGGGFIEFLFGGGQVRPDYRYERDPAADLPPGAMPEPQAAPARWSIDPRYLRQTVRYDGPERPGTVIINTNERFLYLVRDGGTAIRYGVGVGRPGFTWAGVKQVSSKREWPDWTPPPEMLRRRPDLPRYMEGGPQNPLGARALYLGSSLYRIHGSNEPWTIGTQVSSGCIRMRNEDVIDLYQRVDVGTKVVVI